MEFRLAPHKIKPNVTVVEVWEGDQFLATIVPSIATCEIRIVSKYRLACGERDDRPPGVLTITIGE